MSDRTILDHINELVDEEHALRARHQSAEPLSEAERDRLDQLEVQLDECWDLLRQRRAKEQYGEDPNTARERPGSVVEGYQQ